MAYKDDREALIAERNALRARLEEQEAELAALEAFAEQKEALEQEVARLREQAGVGAASAGSDAANEETSEPVAASEDGQSVPEDIRNWQFAVGCMVSFVAFLVLLVVTGAESSEQSSGSAHRRARATSASRASPAEARRAVGASIEHCAPLGDAQVYHVRTVISAEGIVTEATVVGTELGPIEEESEATHCVEVALLGQEVPMLRGVTVSMPFGTSLPPEFMWVAAVHDATPVRESER